MDENDPTLHTNIEAFWKSAKATFKLMNGTVSNMIPSHLDEFLFRNRIQRVNPEVRGPAHAEVLCAICRVIADFQHDLNKQ